jgi:hypothetical protein
MSANPPLPSEQKPLVVDANFGLFSIKLKWTRKSEYLLGKLEYPPTFADLRKGGPHLVSALCDFLWAAQLAHVDKKEKLQFTNPEEVIEHINGENFVCLVDSFCDAFQASAQTTDAQKKR